MALYVTKNQTTLRRTALRALDGALAALLALQMCYQLLPDNIHALLGFAMVTCAIAHLILNARGTRALGRGRVSLPRALLAVSACASAALMFVLGLSGLVLSGLVPTLYGFDAPARAAHLSASYLALLVMPFHTGLHMPFPLGRTKGARLRVAHLSAAWLVLACIGVYELTELHILNYALLLMPFVLPATVPMPVYLLEHGAVMALFALLGSLGWRVARAVDRGRAARE